MTSERTSEHESVPLLKHIIRGVMAYERSAACAARTPIVLSRVSRSARPASRTRERETSSTPYTRRAARTAWRRAAAGGPATGRGALARVHGRSAGGSSAVGHTACERRAHRSARRRAL